MEALRAKAGLVKQRPVEKNVKLHLPHDNFPRLPEHYRI